MLRKPFKEFLATAINDQEKNPTDPGESSEIDWSKSCVDEADFSAKKPEPKKPKSNFDLSA